MNAFNHAPWLVRKFHIKIYYFSSFSWIFSLWLIVIQIKWLKKKKQEIRKLMAVGPTICMHAFECDFDCMILYF